MATATIIFSSPAPIVDGHNEFITNFYPPQNISGRSCYLKVTNVSAVVDDETCLAYFQNFFITTDLPQPMSFASVNNPVNQVVASDGRLIHRDSRNRVVALLNSGGIHGNHQGQLFPQTSFPRILVEIPDGPQQVVVGLWSSYGALTDNLNQLTVVMEITPIDGPDEPDLDI